MLQAPFLVIFAFNQFTLDTGHFCLSSVDGAVSVDPLVFDLLVYLIKHCDRVITREELLENLWAGKIVTDSALGARIKDARKAVKDNGNRQQVIKTIHGRGYQFIADVSVLPDKPSVLSECDLESSLYNPPTPTKATIAVLPFKNLNKDPEQDYFSDGMTEDVTTALSKIKNLFVVAKSSTAHYREKSADLRRISREQGVRYVLEGSVRNSETRIRVNTQLTDTSTGQIIWGERYDRERQDIFAMQDEIMRKIVVALDVQLVEGDQAQVWSSGTTNLEAWELVRQAVFDVTHGSEPETKLRARQVLEKALQLDPDYAIAWVMLGWIYQQYVDNPSMVGVLEASNEPLAAMLDCAQKAIAANPDCAEAYGLMALYYLEIREFDLAVEMAEKSVAMAPNNAINLAEASMIMNKTGNPQRSLELKKKAMRICPMYRPGFLRGLGMTYFLLGDTDAAVDAYSKAIKREPDNLAAQVMLAIIHSERDNSNQALHAKNEILRISPEFSTEVYMQGISFRDKSILKRMTDGLRLSGLPA